MSLVPTRRNAGAALLAVALLGVVAGAPSEAQQADIKIGVILTLSGPPGRAGNRQKDGAELAVERINAAGGIKGRKLRLVIQDDAGDPNAAVTAFNTLAADDEIVAVYGTTIGSSTMAFAPLAKRAGMPVVFPNATYEITRLGNEFLFRVAVPGDVEVRAAVDLAKKSGWSRIAILHSNDAYGKQGADLLAKMAAADVVASESFATSSTDYTPQLTKIRAARPDVIFVWGGVPFTGTAAKNAGQLGITAPLISPTAAGAPANIAAAAGSSALAHWRILGVLDPANPLPRQKTGIEAAREKFKNEPDVFVASGWDAMQVLAAALRSAPAINRAAIKSALENVRGVEGMGGVYSYSATEREGTGADSLIWLRVVDGKLVRSAQP
jgi:branched-chain amino acid transport system substrate-binding protein